MTGAAKCDNCGKMVDFDRYHYVIEGIPAEMVRGFHPRSRFDLCSLECIGQWPMKYEAEMAENRRSWEEREELAASASERKGPLRSLVDRARSGS